MRNLGLGNYMYRMSVKISENKQTEAIRFVQLCQVGYISCWPSHEDTVTNRE